MTPSPRSVLYAACLLAEHSVRKALGADEHQEVGAAERWDEVALGIVLAAAQAGVAAMLEVVGLTMPDPDTAVRPAGRRLDS